MEPEDLYTVVFEPWALEDLEPYVGYTPTGRTVHYNNSNNNNNRLHFNMEWGLSRKWLTLIIPTRPNRTIMIYALWDSKGGSDVTVPFINRGPPTSIMSKTRRITKPILVLRSFMKPVMLVLMINLIFLWSWLMLKELLISLKEDIPILSWNLSLLYSIPQIKEKEGHIHIDF